MQIEALPVDTPLNNNLANIVLAADLSISNQNGGVVPPALPVTFLHIHEAVFYHIGNKRERRYFLSANAMPQRISYTPPIKFDISKLFVIYNLIPGLFVIFGHAIS